MAKVKQPIKEEWDTIEKNKNSPIELIKKENDSGIVRVKRLKSKRRKRGLPRSEPSSQGSTTGVGIKRIWG